MQLTRTDKQLDEGPTDPVWHATGPHLLQHRLCEDSSCNLIPSEYNAGIKHDFKTMQLNQTSMQLALTFAAQNVGRCEV